MIKTIASSLMGKAEKLLAGFKSKIVNVENIEREVQKFEEANRENFDAMDESCRKMKNIIKMIEEFEVPRLCKAKDQTIGFADLPIEFF